MIRYYPETATELKRASNRSCEHAHTTREQTLERCPNLALASAFFAPGTKGLPLVPVGNTNRH